MSPRPGRAHVSHHAAPNSTVMKCAQIIEECPNLYDTREEGLGRSAVVLRLAHQLEALTWGELLAD